MKVHASYFCGYSMHWAVLYDPSSSALLHALQLGLYCIAMTKAHE